MTMERKIQEIKKEANGTIMLEALIVYMVTVFLLFFVLALFCIFYQLWNMQTIANETAARIAQTYKFAEADIDTGYVTLDQLTNLEQYRYLPGVSAKTEQDVQEKLTKYVNRRLDRVSFVHKVVEPMIRLEVKKDGLSSRHVEVSISETFSVPFGEALTYFGYEDEIHYECTAYAECLDLIDYINTVDYADHWTSLDWLDSSAVGMINAFLKLFQNIADKS